MSDWNKQAEDMLKTWTKTQQQLWDTWQSAMPQAFGAQSSSAWRQTVDLWKEAIDRSLKAQSQWADMWASSLKAQPGMPRDMSAMSDQIAATMKLWTQSQAQLWQNMLEATKQTDAQAWVERMGEGGRAALKNWQDAVGKAIDAQRELTTSWTGEKDRSK